MKTIKDEYTTGPINTDLRLDCIDNEILRMRRTFPNVSPKVMGAELGVTPATIREHLRKPIVIAKLEEYNLEIQDYITSKQLECIDVLGDLLKDGDAKIRLGAAKILSQPSIASKLDVTSNGKSISISISDDFIPDKDNESKSE